MARRKVHILASEVRTHVGADIGYGRDPERQLRKLRKELAENGYPKAEDLPISDFEVKKSGAVDFFLPKG